MTRYDAIALVDAGRIAALDGPGAFARRLKASAVEHGCEQLPLFALELEAHVRDEDRDRIATQAAEIVRYVDHVQVVYRRPLEAAEAAS